MSDKIKDAAFVLVIFILGLLAGWSITWGGNVRWQMAYAQLQDRYNNVVQQANDRIQELQAQVPVQRTEPETPEGE